MDGAPRLAGGALKLVSARGVGVALGGGLNPSPARPGARAGGAPLGGATGGAPLGGAPGGAPLGGAAGGAPLGEPEGAPGGALGGAPGGGLVAATGGACEKRLRERAASCRPPGARCSWRATPAATALSAPRAPAIG